MAERKITDLADLFVVIYPAATVDVNLLVVAVAVPELAAVRLDAYLLKICAHVTHQLVAHDKWRCHWGWRLGGWWRWAVANLDPVNTVSVDRRETHHSRNPKHSAQQKLHHHLASRFRSVRRSGHHNAIPGSGCMQTCYHSPTVHPDARGYRARGARATPE